MKKRNLTLGIQTYEFAEIIEFISRYSKNIIGNIYDDIYKIINYINESNLYDTYTNEYYKEVLIPLVYKIIKEIDTVLKNNSDIKLLSKHLERLRVGVLQLKTSLESEEFVSNKKEESTVIERGTQKDYFIDYINKMKDTRKAKNADYGNSFNKSIDKFGYVSAFSRIEDKLSRAMNLIEVGKAEVEDEAIEDSLIDAANYLIMTADDIKQRKNKKDKLIWAKKPSERMN